MSQSIRDAGLDVFRFSRGKTLSLASTTAWHEGMHAGQFTVVKAALGLKPKIG